MRIVVGADHRGFAVKREVIEMVEGCGHEVIDVGTDSADSVDYPDIAAAVGAEVVQGRADRGIVVCGSGVGAAIAANKIDGVRAAMCHDTYSAHQGVEHDDMNVLSLGSGVVGLSLIHDIVHAFLAAEFSSDVERYARRLRKVQALERRGDDSP